MAFIRIAIINHYILGYQKKKSHRSVFNHRSEGQKKKTTTTATKANTVFGIIFSYCQGGKCAMPGSSAAIRQARRQALLGF